MNIIFGNQIGQEIKDRYTILELDTLKLSDQQDPVTAYCLVENIPIAELPQTEMYQDLHKNLIKNYRLRNWKFCEDAIEHLMGKWNGEVDSFYGELLTRVKKFKDQTLDESWSPVLDKTV